MYVQKLQSNLSDAQLILEGWLSSSAIRSVEVRWAQHQLGRLRMADAGIMDAQDQDRAD
jgi:hypothetical protein